MNYIAFFDLDHTLLKINSGEVLLRKAHKKGLISDRKLIIAYYYSYLRKLRIVDSTRLIKKFISWLANYPVSDIENLCNEIIEIDLIPAIRPQMIAEIKMHKEKGAHLVMLSTAIASICSPLATHLGMNSIICTELEVVNQHFTGFPKAKVCFREEKLVRMNQYLHLHQQSIEDSYYYGDSIDDLPVLQSVGFPVCVNPDKRLEKIAKKRNWVIYKWD